MAGSVNKVILIGNLGKDPEVRHLENGAAVANFSIATSENYKDRKTGEKVSQTEWHNIKFNEITNALASLYGRYTLSFGATFPVPNQSPIPLKSFL